jgi:hypothetical protein
MLSMLTKTCISLDTKLLGPSSDQVTCVPPPWGVSLKADVLRAEKGSMKSS